MNLFRYWCNATNAGPVSPWIGSDWHSFRGAMGHYWALNTRPTSYQTSLVWRTKVNAINVSLITQYICHSTTCMPWLPSRLTRFRPNPSTDSLSFTLTSHKSHRCPQTDSLSSLSFQTSIVFVGTQFTAITKLLRSLDSLPRLTRFSTSGTRVQSIGAQLTSDPIPATNSNSYCF